MAESKIDEATRLHAECIELLSDEIGKTKKLVELLEFLSADMLVVDKHAANEVDGWRKKIDGLLRAIELDLPK